jgi:hypothetical protein
MNQVLDMCVSSFQESAGNRCGEQPWRRFCGQTVVEASASAVSSTERRRAAVDVAW